jgi:hypothetical protein
VRVSALAGFEYGVLALIVCPASIAALLLGLRIPKPDFTWPWAIIPPVGFGVVMWVAERYRQRLRKRKGWRGRVGIFLDAVHVIFEILRNPREYWSSVLGMGIYWGAEMFALWAATSAFGFQMSALSVIVAVGTGMIFTRRTAPLGGEGLMLVALVAHALVRGGGAVRRGHAGRRRLPLLHSLDAAPRLAAGTAQAACPDEARRGGKWLA